jgi:hypothetical protein
MDFPHDGLQVVAKSPVTFTAAESTLTSEGFKGQTAPLTRNIVPDLFFAAGDEISGHAGEDLRQREGNIIQRRVKPSGRCALLAQVQRRLHVVRYLRELDESFPFFAVLTKHVLPACFLHPFMCFTVDYLELTVTSFSQFPVMRGNQEGCSMVGIKAKEQLMEPATGSGIQIP